MPKTIWNEGRVLGYSAYETYVRYVVSQNGSPADEKSWLASTLSYGSSLLLWVSPDNTEGVHYRDFAFPTDSKLCAANNIMGSFFSGEGDSNPDGWERKVIDYGPLIENDETASPTNTEIPVRNNGALDIITISRIQDYVKILDGVVIQPGTWTENTDLVPTKTFAPVLSKKPTLRLSFSDKIITAKSRFLSYR